MSQEENEMKATQGEDLLTAGAIATALGAPGATVKKAIKDLAIQPKAKKGVCCYYGQDALEKVRKAVAK
jgi:hypothetical protein